MDNSNATVVGSSRDDAHFKILAHVKGAVDEGNHEKTLQHKFFKEISSHLVNATLIHITGTGQAQEQFIHFLADSAQFKNCKTVDSTSTKMTDEKLIAYFNSNPQ